VSLSLLGGEPENQAENPMRSPNFSFYFKSDLYTTSLADVAVSEEAPIELHLKRLGRPECWNLE
jgi:hypothetical protein